MPSELSHLLSLVASHPDCFVNPVAGQPNISLPLTLPADVAEFYALCGGAQLHKNADNVVRIVAPTEVLPANPVLLGSQYPDDRSSSWYIIAKDDGNDYLTIDLSPRRLGRCYDSFHEIHAVAGSCPIIARSFTELLRRLIHSDGRRWY